MRELLIHRWRPSIGQEKYSISERMNEIKNRNIVNSHEIGKVGFVEMLIMPPKINRLNEIPFKISMIFFTEVEKHSKIHVEL